MFSKVCPSLLAIGISSISCVCCDMEEDMANLCIEDEEDEPVVEHIDETKEDDDFTLCLVGRVLTNGAVHFPSLRNMLAEI